MIAEDIIGHRDSDTLTEAKLADELVLKEDLMAMLQIIDTNGSCWRR